MEHEGQDPAATTVDEARWLQAHGADAIIAQGLEAGGHRGLFLNNDLSTQLGTFALVEMVIFMATVFVAYAYVWRRGGLEWD